MIAIIVGATGMVGSLLIQQLLQDPDVARVVSVSRRPLGIASHKLKELPIADLSALKTMTADVPGDVYFCCLGTTIKDAGSQKKFRKVDHDAIVDFAKIAQANHARVFVLISSAGASASSLFFYSRVKGQTEEDLQKLGLKRLVIFRPSLLLGQRGASRPAERFLVTLATVVSPILPRLLKKNLTTNAQDLANQMLVEGKKSTPQGVKIIAASDI